MRLVYIVLSAVFGCALLVLLFLNLKYTATVNLFSAQPVDVNVWVLLLLSGLLGSGASACGFAFILDITKESLSKQKSVSEKASIKAEESTDKVQSLEAKIQTLEQALKKALKDKK